MASAISFSKAGDRRTAQGSWSAGRKFSIVGPGPIPGRRDQARKVRPDGGSGGFAAGGQLAALRGPALDGANIDAVLIRQEGGGRTLATSLRNQRLRFVGRLGGTAETLNQGGQGSQVGRLVMSELQGA